MTSFIPVTEESFDKIYNKMEAAFPIEERRTGFDEKNCLKDGKFNFFEILDDENEVGFIALWVFQEFVFIEHLAIDSDKRNGGYGSKALNLVKEKFNKPIILEAEAPETEQQIKRIRFYDRHGFKVNDFNYMQPSYHGGEGVPLKILSFPETLSPEEFDNFIALTRKYVYKTAII